MLLNYNIKLSFRLIEIKTFQIEARQLRACHAWTVLSSTGLLILICSCSGEKISQGSKE